MRRRSRPRASPGRRAKPDIAGPDAAAGTELSIGDELVSWGRAALIETRGRVTGRPARAAVGFLEAPDGAILVAAGDPDSDWSRNLIAEPRCRVTIGERTATYRAEVLEGTERNQAIAGLILRYGTPSERLGAGPVFRLLPDASGHGAAEAELSR